MAEVAAASIPPAWEIGKCIWVPIATCINYARKLTNNWEALCKKVSELRSKKDDIVAEIERFRLQRTPTQECVNWRNEVAEMENKVATLEQEFNVEKKCVWGLCPDIWERIKLGKRVVNMITKIDLLIEKKFENGFLIDSPPARVERRLELPSTLSSSAHHTLDRVLNKLRDENTQKIGIWGMGGVVATKLLRKLEGKKYLLLLDDVWDEVDLRVVGFPNANQQNGCKVVLTTRKMEVCRKMGADAELPVSVLANEEAWEMFSSGVGHVATLSTIKPYAQYIVKECGGLPLALKVVCGALRKEENVNVWRNFLRKLRSPATSVIEDLNENVFKVLKLSTIVVAACSDSKPVQVEDRNNGHMLVASIVINST
ncbi:hypothetical protein RHSIM_Rhsim12G0031900 [Rhododendron simsii]|uniref:NB-ARC domain-containing protein n=1 Tax=Rhododendron simsii TaxID=118357 RepID=A0A834G0Q8_RHOSS|nr:hypothetical protein RHSIM_Rhsim12G0031900 [Rhododendron simsii]